MNLVIKVRVGLVVLVNGLQVQHDCLLITLVILMNHVWACREAELISTTEFSPSALGKSS